MSLFKRNKHKKPNKFIDTIEWDDNIGDTMVWRFPHYHAEIKEGAQLIVREGQVAVLVKEGQVADVCQPGCYEFTTSNMPVLTTQKKRKGSFKPLFKVNVYFINTKHFLKQRWGTVNPIMMRDPEFGPVRLCAYGSFCFHVAKNPVNFIRKVVKMEGNSTDCSISEQLRNFAIANFTDYLVESKIAVLDLAANLSEFSSELTLALKDRFREYGIELTQFLIESISLPKVVEQALYKRADREIVGNMATYTQKQFAGQLDDVTNSPLGNGYLTSDIGGLDTDMTMVKPMEQRGAKLQFDSTSTGKTGAEQSNNYAETDFQQGESPYVAPQKMYYAIVSGVQQGPFPIRQLHQLAQWGQLTPNTLVWTKGMVSWLTASSVPSLSKLFGAVPPPL